MAPTEHGTRPPPPRRAAVPAPGQGRRAPAAARVSTERHRFEDLRARFRCRGPQRVGGLIVRLLLGPDLRVHARNVGIYLAVDVLGTPIQHWRNDFGDLARAVNAAVWV